MRVKSIGRNDRRNLTVKMNKKYSLASFEIRMNQLKGRDHHVRSVMNA